MSINYIIASYSGVLFTRLPNEKPEDFLQIQLEHLKFILNEKKEKNIPNLIKNIIIICPKPKGCFYENYYQKEKWISILDVPIHFVDYVGDNKYHSYDQYIQGYNYLKADYYLIIEDDYCIDKNNLYFDIELVNYYKKIFPNNIGYLCSYACKHSDKVYMHGAISNGLISNDTFKQYDNPLQEFYKLKSCNQCPQVMFSILFLMKNIEIKDMSDTYTTHFWSSSKRKFEQFNNLNIEKNIFLPIQMFTMNYFK